MPRLKQRYQENIALVLKDEFKIANPMAVPRIEKIVLSMGIGAAALDKKRIEPHVGEMAQISGQKPLITKSRKSISNFKLREGMPVGLKVTLRGQRMYEFLDRLITMAIPRIKDFRGLEADGFDGRGNYNMGLTEQSVFPEIDLDSVAQVQGMNIAIVTTADNDDRARRLLTLFGMPIKNSEK